MKIHGAAGRLLAAALLLAAAQARAQFIDRIELERAGAETEIRIRFVTTVQYVRHSPVREGTLLSIALRFTGRLENQEGRTVLESRRTAATPALPAFSVTFPQEDGTLGVQFNRKVSYRVRPGRDARSISVYVPVPQAVLEAEAAARAVAPPPEAPAATPAPAAPPVAPAEVEAQAKTLFDSARASLARGETAAAVETLNRLLNLPPNRQSETAQALIGEARERNGEPAKARAEYELYLKLYPKGAAAERVRTRLAALPAAQPAGTGLRRPEKTEFSISGGFSQFYYRGNTKFDATLAPPAPGLQFDRVSLTAVDQSSLVNSLDFTARVRAPEYDGKFVFRDLYTANYLEGQDSNNRLYAAYYEHQTAGGWLARAGRQPGVSSGLLGRFDGLWAGYKVAPNLRLNALAGHPVEFFPTPRKSVHGANVDILPDAPGWNANLFYVEQRVDSVLDRRAVGAELRYFDARRSAFGLLDYDVDFRALNVLLLQGNVITEDGTSYTALLDHRRVPALQLTNALPGQSEAIPGVTSPGVAELLASGVSRETLREQAVALTPVSDLFLLGVTRPVLPKLQLGADWRVSRVSGTEASGNLPASPGTGNVYVYSGQAIKTGVLSSSDTGVASASLISGGTYRGLSAALSHVFVYERWRTEAALRYYRQTNDLDVRLVRWAPSFRTIYRWRDSLSFEFELGQETTTNDGPLQSDRTVRRYFSLGYRWDFL